MSYIPKKDKLEILKKITQLNQLLILSMQRYNVAFPEENNSDADKNISDIAALITASVTELLDLDFEDLESILEKDERDFEEFKAKYGLISEMDTSIPN
tara:strand:- start:46 stop:342 length:297 start_codon:yes stop_codon:yes gene_type:complete